MPITFPERATAPKQNRNQRRFYVDARIDPTQGSPLFYLLGEDNDDLSRDISWNSDTKKNVLGNTTVSSTITEESVSAEPFYARDGDAMSELLQHFDLSKSELDSIKRNYYEVKLDNDGVAIYAFRQVADIKLQSVGGSSEDADNLPFELGLSGPRVEMDYSLATETFTEKA